MTISNTPPPEAILAIESGLTKVVRRMEIYESDGETLWVPPNGDVRSRLVGGNINLAYDRDERRTVDCTLTNEDEMLEVNDGEGFWYNKILKPYRGVEYFVPILTQRVEATNRILNPGFEGGSTSNHGVIATHAGNRQCLPDAAYEGDFGFRATATADGVPLGNGAYTDTLQPGTYTGAYRVYTSKTIIWQNYWQGTATGKTFSTSQNQITLQAGTWNWIQHTVTITGAGTLQVGGYTGASCNIGDYMQMDTFILVAGTSLDAYFDGSYPDARWTGAANSSTSELLRNDVKMESRIWETQMGEFMIDRIAEGARDSTVKVAGRDYTKKCLTSKITSSMSFRAGTYLYDLVRALAANSGITKMKIPYTNETIGARIDLERGTERWKIMKDAANSNNYDLYFDNQGFLTMSKFNDPTLSPPVLTFKQGSGGNLVTWEKSVNDSRLYNHIAIYGDRESQEGGEILMPYFGEAINEDPNSPTNVKEIGDRYFSFASSFFTNDEQCQRLAESWLKINSLESYEINWSSLYYPHLDVGKIVEVFEPKKKQEGPTKFLLDTLDFSLGLEPMGCTGKRVLITN